jgi:hypothetical protein
MRITQGRQKAIRTVAAAFNPGVFVNISIEIPIRKDRINNSHR